MKASDYKDNYIPLMDEDDYDKTLSELLYEYHDGEYLGYEGATVCLCRICQVLAPIAREMEKELDILRASQDDIEQVAKQLEKYWPGEFIRKGE